MKIIFICSSLEPGRDGVGDYTKQLAVELRRKNYEVRVVALNDRYISITENSILPIENILLPILRLPSIFSLKKRMEVARVYISSFNPEWISFQYVSFGFHPKGLPIQLIESIHSLGPDKKWHIMFHELWCGMSENSGLKEKILGFVQKKTIQRLIKNLKPKKIFTSIEYYSIELFRIKYNAEVIPIFGNIPLNMPLDESWYSPNIVKINSILKTKYKKYLIVGFFGTVYSCVGLDELLYKINLVSKSLGYELAILSIGYNRGINISTLIEDVSIFETGIVSSATINGLMELVDIGVMTSPSNRLHKSGSAIAWIERGIPILVSDRDKTYEENRLKKLGVIRANSLENVLFAISLKGKIDKVDYFSIVNNSYIEMFNTAQVKL